MHVATMDVTTLDSSAVDATIGDAATNRGRDGYGLYLSVYRDAGDPIDYTLGGVTSRHTELTLVGVVDYTRRRVGGDPEVRMLPRDCRVFPPTEAKPPVWLVIGKHGAGDVHLIPGDVNTGLPDARWWMMGGNYAATSDSRFSDLTGMRAAVRVHDRHEG